MLIGDGVTDDRAALQALIDACPYGGSVSLPSDKTFRMVIDGSVPDTGLILKPGVTLDWGGSRGNFECNGNVYGARMQSGSRCVNGRVGVTASAGLNSQQGVYHAPIGIGAAYGEVLSTTNRGPFIEAADWRIQNMTLSTVKTVQACHIAGMGGVCHGVISDIAIADSATAFGAINFDAGTVGVPSSVTQDKVNFQNGSFWTNHPHDIHIDRISIGAMTYSLSEAIRLSACRDIHISNVHIKVAGASGFSHYGGDYGFEFCRYSDGRYQPYMNNVVRNLTIESTLGNAVRLDTWGDNVAREPGYTPLSNPIWPTNLLIDGLVANGSNGTGMYVGKNKGIIVQRARLNFFHSGAHFEPGIVNMRWLDSTVYGTDANSILYDGSLSGVTMERVNFEY